MKTILFIIFLLFLLSLSSCKEESIPPPQESVLNLKLEDVSCTEAWITLTTTNLQLPTSLYLLRNDIIFKTLNLQTADTLLYIDSLLPNQTYDFQISGIGNPASGIKSNIASATTLDTTSHNFTFKTFEFGTSGSSVLYDVAIINENNIWAVGEIEIADTSANGYTMYNAVHWNGIEWTLHRIMFKTICGQPSSQNAYPASSIIAFSENENWVAQKGDQIAKIENGVQINSICMPWTFSINKIWGSSSNNLYVVGNNGNIAHYNGSQWTKIESGTNLHIYDIWGAQDNNNSYEVLCIASNRFVDQGKKVFKINQMTVEQISDSGLPWSLSTVWFIPDRKYFIGGDGLYSSNLLDEYWVKDYSMPPYYKTKIRGSGFNNIFMVGAFGLLLHFNGRTWYNYQEYISGSFASVDMKDNLVVCVGGLNNNRAIIKTGKRIN